MSGDGGSAAIGGGGSLVARLAKVGATGVERERVTLMAQLKEARATIASLRAQIAAVQP